MPQSDVRPVDYRQLMKKVEQVVGALERNDETGRTIHTVADAIIAQFQRELGLSGGRLYRRDGDFYLLEGTFHEAKDLPPGLRVPVSYEPIEALLAEGAVYMDETDPRIDRELESELGVSRFAAIEVGDEDYVLAFDVAPGHHREDILFSLGVLRHSINQKLRQERMEEVFREARRIQTSILPRRIPVYGEFDMWGRIDTVDSVGGDFYDYIPLTYKILGLAIADVSGHGLPAALQVRDIYMGLRMGLARDLKIVRTVERLNNIIHRSTLTSRFVSMFYGELELNGVFIYVNAGHPPPFHMAANGDVRFLEEGGAVLGPLAEATYERGFVRLAPGDLLVLYTDGMIETQHAAEDGPGAGEEYGIDRLVAVAREHRHRGAREIGEALLADVRKFAEPGTPEDDRTVLIVRYRDSAAVKA